VTADLEIQRAVLALVLREDPDVLTLPALAGRVLANPRSLTGGVALARALRELDNEGLVFSDGVLVRPSRPALHVKRLLGAGLMARQVQMRQRCRTRTTRHPRLRSDGVAIDGVPTVAAGVDGRALDLLDSHPDFDRSAFAWVGSEHMGDGIYCASIYTGTAADSPYMWIADMAEVAVKTGRGWVEGEEGKFILCVFVGDADGRDEQPPALLVAECNPDDLAAEVLRMLDSAGPR
jgi:hypothetical protein